MDQEYDVIVLGTGLKECILSGLMSVAKLKVLHMDRNSYYGGESASVNLDTLWKKFRPEEKTPEDLGRSRDYNIDLCPKFLMSCGDLVKVLLHTRVTKYLEFKSVAGSFVFKEGKIHKVPSSAKEALDSSLMSFFQKRRFRNFLVWVNQYNQDDPKTWETLDCSKVTSKDVFSYWKLEDDTIQFVGHAMALNADDSYLNQPAKDMIEKVKLYAYSVARYGNSPYIYPLWGLGGLPEGFSRLAAIHGGTYMLNKPVEQIVYDKDGKVVGVKSEGQIAKCKKLIGDPTYFLGTNKIKKVGQVARCIAIMGHPIPGTDNADSCQIILPAKTLPGRQSDIYISCVSYHHQIAAKGKYVSSISCPLESADKDPKTDLKNALELLGKIDHAFFWISDRYEPTDNGIKDNVFVTTSYDATTHFESATREVIDMYVRLLGRPIDLSAKPDEEPTDEPEQAPAAATAVSPSAPAASPSAPSPSAPASTTVPTKTAPS